MISQRINYLFIKTYISVFSKKLPPISVRINIEQENSHEMLIIGKLLLLLFFTLH